MTNEQEQERAKIRALAARIIDLLAEIDEPTHEEQAIVQLLVIDVARLTLVRDTRMPQDVAYRSFDRAKQTVEG